MPPRTVEAIVLLGWMERDFAVNYLRTECVFEPALSEEQAEAIWRDYRERVQGLPPLEAKAPVRLPLDLDEDRAAQRFMGNHRASPNIRDVIKIDPMALVTHQPFILLGRANDHAPLVSSKAGWIEHCLSTVRPPERQLQVRCAPNAMDVVLPHGEFVFVFDPARGFQIQELAKHVSVTAFGDRMWLWAGYHRSYARVANMAPEAIDRSLLVALTTDGDFMLSSNSPNQGLRQMVRGFRPPLFRDFFDDRLFMRVRLRKRRFELQIRANVVPIDDET